MADTTTKLSIVIDAENKADAAFASLNGQLNDTQSRMQNIVDISKTVAAAGAVAFAAISGVIYMTVSAAADAQAKLAAFNTTLDTMGAAGQAAKQPLLDAAQAAANFGFTNEEAETSLAKMFQRTGDVAQAMSLFNLSMDLARSKNIDLGTATNLVNMALSGQGRALLQYGIVIKDTAGPLEALQELQGYVGGQAAAFADTFSGKMAIMAAKTDELKQSIGNSLLPVLTDLLTKLEPVIEDVTNWITIHPKLTEYILLGSLALAGLAVVLGTIGMVLPAIISGTTILYGGLLALGTATAPMLALAAALIAVYNAYENLIGEQAKDKQAGQDLTASQQKLLPLIAAEKDPVKKAQLEKLYNSDTVAANNVTAVGNMSLGQSLISGWASDLGISQSLVAPLTGVPTVNFTFNGDVNDKDALVKSVTDTINRNATLKTLGAN